jgi:hypothetical protein
MVKARPGLYQCFVPGSMPRTKRENGPISEKSLPINGLQNGWQAEGKEKGRWSLRSSGLRATGGESGIRTPDLRIMIPSL